MKICYDQGAQRYRSCHYKELTPLPVLLAAVNFSALGTVLPKSFTGAFSSDSRLDVCEVYVEPVKALSRYFGMKFLWLEKRKKMDNLDVRPLSNYF